MHICCSPFAQLFAPFIAIVFCCTCPAHGPGSTLGTQLFFGTWQGKIISISIQHFLYDCNHQCLGGVRLQAEALRAAAVRHLAALDAWLQTSQESAERTCRTLHLNALSLHQEQAFSPEERAQALQDIILERSTQKYGER